jgi:hypothetical protein
MIELHDMILSACGVHHVTASTVGDIGIANKGQLQRTTAVLVASEFGNGSLSILGRVELNNTRSFGAAVPFVLNLGFLDRADRGEEVDEILVASGPGELFCVNNIVSTNCRQHLRCERG